MSDLQTFFDTDPDKLSDADIDAIIAEMRKNRHTYNLGNLKAGSTKPKTEKQKQVEALTETLGLDSLGL